MKTNLKHKPQLRGVYPVNSPEVRYRNRVDKWFKDFESELRHAYDYATDEPSDEMDKLDNLMRLVTEILGKNDGLAYWMNGENPPRKIVADEKSGETEKQ